MFVMGRGDNHCVDKPALDHLLGITEQGNGPYQLANGRVFFRCIVTNRRQAGVIDRTRE